MATIKDVARQAGVSITTVSATLNDTAPVSQALRERVWAAVEAVGYQPDPVARHLRSGKSMTVGLVVPDISTPWAARLAKVMHQAFSRRGYTMFFASNDDDPEAELKDIEAFGAHRVAGLVIAATSRGENYAARLQKAVRCPAVLIDRVIAGAPFDTVTDDNRLGAELLTRYLLKLGHRKIALLAGRPGISSSDERVEGFLATMAQAGLSVADHHLLRSIYQREQAFSAVQQLMSDGSPPTALLTINVAQTHGAMTGLKNMGLRPPADISLASFDGFHDSEGWYPAITSLMQDVEAASARASERLLGRIEGDEKAGQPVIERIPPRLVVRESCRQI